MVDTYAPIVFAEIDGQKLPEEITNCVESFSYEDHEDKMDELKITLAHGDLSLVDHPQLQEGNEIRVRWGYIGNLSEPRTCTIKKIDYTFGEDGVARMEIDALDKRHNLTGRSARTCWHNKNVEEVVKDIAKKHNMTPVVEVQEDLTREYISQGGKNDMLFLAELARDTGCSMWVTNNELHFEPNRLNDPVLKFRWKEDRDGYLQSFKISSKAERGKGTGRGTEMSGVDPVTKKPIKETIAAKAEKGGKIWSLEKNREASAEEAAKLRGSNKSSGGQPAASTKNETELQQNADEAGRVVPTPAPTSAAAKREGKGKVSTSAMGNIEATATTIGLPYLKAKDTVTIENIGNKFSGSWRIKKVCHKISRDSYMCDLTLCKANYEGSGGGKAGDPPKTVQSGKDAVASAGDAKNSANGTWYSADTKQRVQKK